MTSRPQDPRSNSRPIARAAGALLVAAAVSAMAVLPAGVAQTTLVDLTIGAPASNDFEDGPQDWVASVPAPTTRPAPTDTWQWGAPTSGPGIAASGSNVWATNLSGNYAASQCSGLLSPPIDLTGATSASLSFKHWRHMDQFSSTSTFVGDGGMLMVTADGGTTFTRITGTGYTTNSMSSVILPCFDGAPSSARGYTGPPGATPPAPTYASNGADLSAFVGQTVQVAFVFASNCCTHRAGWYLDDVATTIDGVTTTEDFEASDGGFTQVGTKVAPAPAQGWSHGVPTTGPGTPTAMWATNLHGNHGPSECNWIESPPIDLGPLPSEAGAVATATLSWSQWFRGGSVSSAGVVQIGTSDGFVNIVPTTGYPSNPTNVDLRACTDHAATGAFAGFIDAVGAPMNLFEADISAFLGKTVTVRFLFASTSSTVTNPGWYVDDVNVETAIEVVAPDPEDLVPEVPGVNGADAPLWTHGGVKPSWGYGVALSGPVNETVYKTNLTGSYSTSECSWIQSPSVPGAVVASNPTLKFDHWYEMESIFSTSTWDAGIVMVSADGGATWSYLELAEYDRPMTTSAIKACVGSHGVADTVLVFSGDHTASFETVVADLSAFADAPSVTFRFLFGSDTSVQYDGWAIKNVEIGGVKVL